MELIISGSPAFAANCLVVRCPAFILAVAISSLHAHHLMGRIKDRAEVSAFGLARQGKLATSTFLRCARQTFFCNPRHQLIPSPTRTIMRFWSLNGAEKN
jgi:hypothetical protein